MKVGATYDVCLVLEGTYPYVSGGVSTWVHQIISELPDVSFCIYYLGATASGNLQKKYDVPANVGDLKEVFLFDPLERSERRTVRKDKIISDAVYGSFRRLLFDGTSGGSVDAFQELAEVVMKTTNSFPCESIWHDREGVQLIEDAYQRFLQGESFLNFYWSTRFLIQPAWKLIRDIGRIPQARIYHSLCTGYAGMAAALAARRNGGKYLLSEHGIYMKERLAEIQKATWMKEIPEQRPGLFRELSSFKRLWIEFFQLLTRLSYDSAAHITSLFDYNRRLQVSFGADFDKIEIIPNGIRCESLAEVRAQRREAVSAVPGRMNVGFLGRIVPIKDVKTLIRAARMVVNELPSAKFLVAGGTDEDPGYYESCFELSRQLGLEQHLEFLGPKVREEFLQEVDVLVLTSISEGLPFVVLEAFASEIPVISTDVGACRELIEGKVKGDPSAGRVTAIARPEETAKAIIDFLTDERTRVNAGEVGLRRASQDYAQANVVERYRQLYLGGF